MSLEKTAFDPVNGRIGVQRGKSRAARRELKLTQEALAIIAKHLDTFGPWVFGSPKNAGRHITKLNCPHDRVLAKTGLSFVLYDLRHTFATRMIEAGADLPTLKSILGHTDVRTTMRYVHLTQPHQDAATVLYEKSRGSADRGMFNEHVQPTLSQF